MTFIASVNETALAVFGVVVGVTMIITYIASKRVSTATDFWAAGRALTGPQNGLAIAGDYISAASFLGIAGLIFVYGFDAFLYCVGFLRHAFAFRIARRRIPRNVEPLDGVG